MARFPFHAQRLLSTQLPPRRRCRVLLRATERVPSNRAPRERSPGSAGTQCQPELDYAIACWTRERTVDVVLRVMDAAGVPAGRIYTAADIAVDLQYASRDMVIEVPEPGLDGESVRRQGVVPKLSETPATLRAADRCLANTTPRSGARWSAPSASPSSSERTSSSLAAALKLGARPLAALPNFRGDDA
jgi:hypothetical protein